MGKRRLRRVKKTRIVKEVAGSLRKRLDLVEEMLQGRKREKDRVIRENTYIEMLTYCFKI